VNEGEGEEGERERERALGLLLCYSQPSTLSSRFKLQRLSRNAAALATFTVYGLFILQ
jgi:hypothetical protein